MVRLRDWYRREQFNPGLLGAFCNPFFLARRALWAAISEVSGKAGGRLLDVGCGRKPYRDLFRVEEYIGLEIDSTLTRARGFADFYYDGKRFPFSDASFGTVLCNQVLEHVFCPDEFIVEIKRVLAGDGLLILTVPFVWDEHEQPFDYGRYTSFGLEHLLERHGFMIIEQRKTLADFSILAQLFNAYIFKTTRTRFPVVNAVLTALVLAPISLGGLLLGALMPGNPDLFLDSVVIARKVS